MGIKSLFKGASISLISKVLNALFNFLTLVILARILSIEEFGYFNFILTTLPFLSLLSMLGTDYLGLSDYPLKREKGTYYYNNALISSLIIILSSSFLLALIIFGIWFYNYNYNILNPNTNYIYLALIILTPLQSFIIFSRIINQSKLFFFRSNFPEYIFRPFFFFLFVFFIFIVLKRISMFHITLIYIFVFLITLIISLIWIRFDLKFDKASLSRFRFEKSYLLLAPQYALVQALNQGNLFLFPLFIGHFLSVSDVSYYRAGSQTASLISFILVALNNAFAPVISKYYVLGKKEDLENLYLKITKYTLIFSTFMYLCVFWYSKEIMSMFGKEFVAHSYVLSLMAFTQIFVAVSGPSGMLLLMTKKQKYVIFSTIVQLILTFGFSFVLIEKLALLGSIIGLAIGMSSFNLLLAYFVWSKMNIRIINREICFLLIIFIVALFLLGIIQCFDIVSQKTILSLIILLIILLAYCLFIFVYVLQKDEKDIKRLKTDFVNIKKKNVI
ncbi:oligosaccharide flippase family protein [Geobacillus stearothermophilus]|nr:oligosaccharide flippase family protein [Geobacillus stearothermophilus]WJQ10483.1 oligosaccharide flippase family protein [Geobacillus stearothermophilus]